MSSDIWTAGTFACNDISSIQFLVSFRFSFYPGLLLFLLAVFMDFNAVPPCARKVWWTQHHRHHRHHRHKRHHRHHKQQLPSGLCLWPMSRRRFTTVEPNSMLTMLRCHQKLRLGCWMFWAIYIDLWLLNGTLQMLRVQSGNAVTESIINMKTWYRFRQNMTVWPWQHPDSELRTPKIANIGRYLWTTGNYLVLKTLQLALQPTSRPSYKPPRGDSANFSRSLLEWAGRGAERPPLVWESSAVWEKTIWCYNML